MKTRAGFVSNSSSSSFILLGYKLKNSKEAESLVKSLGGSDDAEDYYDYLQQIDGIDFLSDDGPSYIGVLIGKGDACGDEMPDVEYTFDELDKAATRIAKKLKIDKSKIKLYSGTVAC